MRTRSIILLLSATLLSIGCSREPASDVDAENSKKNTGVTLDRETRLGTTKFDTGKDGRFLLVTVHWDDEPLIFILDTGAQMTCFDSSLKTRLGDPVRRVSLQTSAGLLDTEVFACPDATVGGLTLDDVETVLCTDLQPIRYAVGEDIRGILGVDFLRRFIVTIDFDRGRVYLSEPSTSDAVAGKAWVPMHIDETGRPHLSATVGGTENATVLVDTGTSGGTVNRDLYDVLVRKSKIATCDANLGLTVGGSYRQSFGYLSELQIGQFRLGSMKVARHFEDSIGLDWLSRFQVSLDFPNRRIMLKKGNRFDEPFTRARCGMAVVVVDGRKIVVSVDLNSPANAAGLLRGDELVAIGSEQADELDMFDVSKALTAEVGKPVAVTIRRGTRTHSTTIRLADALSPKRVR